MVKFSECGNGRNLEYAFTDFDGRIADVFESACRTAFSAVKDAVLEDCKTLRAAVEDAALHDERYADNRELLEEVTGHLSAYGQERQMERAGTDFARAFSECMEGFYKACCFDRDFMKAVKMLGTEGRDRISKTLASRDGYTKLNLGLHKAFLEFEDILRFDDGSVQKILRAVDQVDLACALKISSDELKAKIFGNMSRSAGEMLQEDMEAVKPVLKSTVHVKESGLPCNIRCGCDREWSLEPYLDGQQKPRFAEVIRFENRRGREPGYDRRNDLCMTISDTPEILEGRDKCVLSDDEIRRIKDFVITNREAILAHARGETDSCEFQEACRKNGSPL